MEFVRDQKQLTLKDLALAASAVGLWAHAASKKSLPPHIKFLVEKYFEDLEVKVLSNVSRIPAPESIKELFPEAITLIGWQLYFWRENRAKLMDTLVYLEFKDFYWTPFLTIDEAKTIDMVIKKNCFDIYTSFKLACNYCLKDTIYELWTKNREFYTKKFICSRSLILNFWILYIESQGNTRIIHKLLGVKRNNRNRHRLFQQLLVISASKHLNEPATKYFLQTLNNCGERNRIIMNVLAELIYSNYEIFSLNTITSYGSIFNSCAEKFVGPVNFHNYKAGKILCLLLSNLDEEGQMEVIKRFQYVVLKLLIDLPEKELFLKIMQRIWDFYFLEEMVMMLMYLARIQSEKANEPCLYYKDMLETFWLESPQSFKDHVIYGTDFFGANKKCYLYRNVEFFQLIMKYLSTEEQKIMFYIYDKRIHPELNALQLRMNTFRADCTFSADEMVGFRSEYIGYYERHQRKGHCRKAKRAWNRMMKEYEDMLLKTNE